MCAFFKFLARSHKFGRQAQASYDDQDEDGGGFSYSAGDYAQDDYSEDESSEGEEDEEDDSEEDEDDDEEHEVGKKEEEVESDKK